MNRDAITLEECMKDFKEKGQRVNINNGRITSLVIPPKAMDYIVKAPGDCSR